MQDVFKGFLRLRLIALLVLAFVGCLVLGISALGRGSIVLGVVLLAGVGVVAPAAIGLLLTRRGSRTAGNAAEKRAGTGV